MLGCVSISVLVKGRYLVPNINQPHYLGGLALQSPSGDGEASGIGFGLCAFLHHFFPYNTPARKGVFAKKEKASRLRCEENQ